MIIRIFVSKLNQAIELFVSVKLKFNKHNKHIKQARSLLSNEAVTEHENHH